MVYAREKMVTAPEDTMFESSSEDIPRSEEISISQAAVKCENARYPMRIPGETVKKERCHDGSALPYTAHFSAGKAFHLPPFRRWSSSVARKNFSTTLCSG